MGSSRERGTEYTIVRSSRCIGFLMNVTFVHRHKEQSRSRERNDSDGVAQKGPGPTLFVRDLSAALVWV
jgi:hypothetical protein